MHKKGNKVISLQTKLIFYQIFNFSTKVNFENSWTKLVATYPDSNKDELLRRLVTFRLKITAFRETFSTPWIVYPEQTGCRQKSRNRIYVVFARRCPWKRRSKREKKKQRSREMQWSVRREVVRPSVQFYGVVKTFRDSPVCARAPRIPRRQSSTERNSWPRARDYEKYYKELKQRHSSQRSLADGEKKQRKNQLRNELVQLPGLTLARLSGSLCRGHHETFVFTFSNDMHRCFSNYCRHTKYIGHFIFHRVMLKLRFKPYSITFLCSNTCEGPQRIGVASQVTMLSENAKKKQFSRKILNFSD